MEKKYLSFTSNAKHYLVLESDIMDRWLSISDKGIENLVLRNGFQYRATNLKEITLLDLSSIPEKSAVVIEDPLGF